MKIGYQNSAKIIYSIDLPPINLTANFFPALDWTTMFHTLYNFKNSSSGGWTEVDGECLKIEGHNPSASDPTGPLSWFDAKDTCFHQGARLATVTTQAQDDWIYTNVPSSMTVWIGIAWVSAIRNTFL